MSRVKVTLTAGLAALALGGGMMMASAPAQAEDGPEPIGAPSSPLTPRNGSLAPSRGRAR